MTITTRSRYLTAPLQTIDTGSDNLPNRGNNITIYPMAPIFDHVNYTRYVTRQGDTFQTISFNVWGDAVLWYRIADANPQVFYPADFPPGLLIRIPGTS
jgi:nucleoid-associated protein YgaU